MDIYLILGVISGALGIYAYVQRLLAKSEKVEAQRSKERADAKEQELAQVNRREAAVERAQTQFTEEHREAQAQIDQGRRNHFEGSDF